MDPRSPARWLRILLLVLAPLAALAVALLAANQLLSLWAALETAPLAERLAWWGLVLVPPAAVGWLLWRALAPRRAGAGQRPAATPTEAELRSNLESYAERGFDTAAAGAELAELDRRRAGGQVVVAVFGRISAGKSSVIQALVPEAAVSRGVLGGTTEQVTRYAWEAPGGAALELADLPGTHGLGADDSDLRDEAQRAHLVLFVADGDLDREEWRLLDELRELGKPMVVAVNKADRYSPADRRRILDRLAGRLDARVPVVAVTAGGEEEVLRRAPDGSETRQVRRRPADLRALRRALQQALDAAGDGLEQRRDEAVFLLTARKLDRALREQRRDAGHALVERYARRAVVGALAAVAPGSDLVIQGALAAALVRELCALYQVPVREVDLERLLAALRKRAGQATPLALGVAGNALKAFPGLGTLSGGLVHAVGYGIIFRNAGAAVLDTLERRGELAPAAAAERFEEQWNANLEADARRLAEVALAEREQHDDPRS